MFWKSLSCAGLVATFPGSKDVRSDFTMSVTVRKRRSSSRKRPLEMEGLIPPSNCKGRFHLYLITSCKLNAVWKPSTNKEVMLVLMEYLEISMTLLPCKNACILGHEGIVNVRERRKGK